jgi:hypothetical protein
MKSLQFSWPRARVALLALGVMSGSGVLGCSEVSAEADMAATQEQSLRLADQAPAELGTEPDQGLATSVWRSARSMANARHDHVATLLLSGQVLVVGGQKESTFHASAELYDPATDTWKPTGSLTDGRTSFAATLLPGGQVLVVGGYGSSGRVWRARSCTTPRPAPGRPEPRS